MFCDSFAKIAATLVTLTPEEYYDIVREKDPYVGAVTGGLAGKAVGALKSPKGKRSKGAVIGALVGATTGAGVGAGLGSMVRKHQAKKVRRIAEGLHLKSSPGRKRGEE